MTNNNKKGLLIWTLCSLFTLNYCIAASAGVASNKHEQTEGTVKKVELLPVLLGADEIEGVTIPLGSTIILSCLVDTANESQSFFSWYLVGDQNPSDNRQMLFSCSFAECIRLPENKNNNMEISHGELKILSIDRANSGEYFCEKYTTDGQSTTLKAKIIAGTPPYKPTIEVDQEDFFKNRNHFEFVDGDEVVLKCTTSGGYPKPTFRWANDKLDKIPADETIHASEYYGKSESKLRLKLSSNDNHSRIKCYVSNSMDNNLEIGANFNINVRYKPSIEGPQNQMHWRLFANETTIVECKVRAYPTPTVKWLDVRGEIVSNTSILRLGRDSFTNRLLDSARDSITSGKPYQFTNEQTMYTCIANSSEGSAHTVINVEAMFAPLINVPKQVKFTEGSSLETIQCHVLSNPKPNFVSWTKVHPMNRQQQQWNNSLLKLENISVDTAGRYRCEAENHINPTEKKYQVNKVHAEVEVIVQYKPRKPQIKISQQETGMIMAGDRVEIACHANDFHPGLPAPEYRLYRSRPGVSPEDRLVKMFIDGYQQDWELLKDFNLKMNLFIIKKVSLQDEGVYLCETENSLGRSLSDPLSLEVNSQLKWIKKPTNLEIDLVQNNPSRDIQLVTIVQSDKMPRIIWMRNGLLLFEFNFEREYSRKLFQNEDIHLTLHRDEMLNEIEIKLIIVTDNDAASNDRKGLIWQVKSILKWSNGKIEPGDEGDYSCIVHNDFSEGESLRQDFTITLKYPIKLFPGHEDIQYFDQKGQINCSFLSPTQPRDVTFMQDGVAMPVTKPGQLILNKNIKYGTSIWSASYLLTQVHATLKRSLFSCLAKNEYGEARGSIRLIENGHPTKIDNLIVENVSWDCADLSWKRNHNGGSPQTFVLGYSVKDSQKAYREFNLTEADIRIVPSTSSVKYQFCGLDPDEVYALRVYTINALGRSSPSAVVEFKTKKLDLPFHVIHQYVRANKELKVFPPRQRSKHCVHIEYSSNNGYNWDQVQRVCSSDVERLLQQRPNILQKSSREIYYERLFSVNYPMSTATMLETEMQQDDLSQNGKRGRVQLTMSASINNDNNYVVIKHPSDLDVTRKPGKRETQFYRLRNCLVDQPHICNKPYIIDLNDQKKSDLTTPMMAIIILVSTFCLLIFIVLSLIVILKVKNKKTSNNNIRMKNLSRNLTQCMSRDYPSLLNNTETTMPNNQIPSPSVSSSKFGVQSLRAASTVNTLASNNTANGRLWTNESSQITQQQFGSDSTMSLLPLGPAPYNQQSESARNLWKIQDHIYLDQQTKLQSQQHINVYTPSIHQKHSVFVNSENHYNQSPSISGDSSKENQYNQAVPPTFYSTSLQRVQPLNSQNVQVYFPITTNGQDLNESAFITTVQLSNDVPVELITVDGNHQADSNIFFRTAIDQHQSKKNSTSS